MAMNKKAFMFTLDAMLASILLIGGLLLISQYLVKDSPRESMQFVSTDLLSALSEIKVNELDSDFVNNYLLTSYYTDINLSVIEQIGTYWAANEVEYAVNLTKHVLDNVLLGNIGMNLVMESDVLYEKNISNWTTLVAGERMITGIMQGAPFKGSTSSAYLRRINDKSTSSFAYFGGFVGQGNITVRLDNIPSDISTVNIKEMFLEGEFDSNFNLLINGDLCDFISVSGSTIRHFNISSCSSLIDPGNNTITLNFVEGFANASVSGGLLGIKYLTSDFGTIESEGYKKLYLPGIDSVINLYDGIMVPGTLNNMSVYLHYWIADNVSLPIYFDIGNTTVMDINITGEQTMILDNTYLDTLLAYNNMSDTTTPFRIGFYNGNNSNSTGNVTDMFLITSRHNSMGTVDIVVDATTTISRLNQAKVVDKLFVEVAINATGNTVGLISFGTGASVDLDSGLSTNIPALSTIIDGYFEHPTGSAQRYLCGAMEMAKSNLLVNSGAGRRKAVMLMTDGDLLKLVGNTARCSGSPTNNRDLIWADAVKQACDFSDFTHGNPYNITFYTVAFGPEAASDPAIIGNLSLMANCTGGKFAIGANASELENIYREFAEELSQSQIVFSFQRATSATDVESKLYDDSFIEFFYEPSVSAIQQNHIPLTIQTNQFGNCNPTINIPDGVEVIDAHIVSYSGDFWTKELIVDGNTVFNLSDYGLQNFSTLGDPFQVLVPPQLLTIGDHTFSITLGANISEDVPCSINDSLIYTGLVSSSTNRSVVLSSDEGCIWLIESEDAGFSTISVPEEYAGSNECNFTNASIIYNSDDVYDSAVFQLLSQLDLDNDGRTTINFEEEDLDIQISIVSDVPYLWGPSIVKVRTWQ